MAEEDDIEDEEEEGGEADSEEGEGGPKKKGKKKLLIIVALVLLLVFGGVAGAYFTGLLDPVVNMVMGEPEVAAEQVGEEGPALGGVYYEIPELLVNLNTAGRKSAFLKIRISLEINSPADIPRIEQIMPRIIDNFQVYLRELRIEDLQGAAGMYRLREELLTRVSAAASPIRVKDVLFREMLIQ